MANSEQLAKMLMQDAQEQVRLGHAPGPGKGWARAVKHIASQAGRGMQHNKEQVGAIGIGLAATGGVAIAGLIVGTGGIAIPVLMAIGGATLAVQKMINLVGGELRRQNRNWLQRYEGSKGAGIKEHANFLTCEAGDAIRRAVDHYRITKKIVDEELQHAKNTNYATCQDAINHVKAVARFVHHADKTRNYLLPCMDMCIFYLEQYKEMAKMWKETEQRFDKAMVMWFDYHQRVIIGTCAYDQNKHVCYGPRSSQGTVPRRPFYKDKTAGWELGPGDTSPKAGALDLEKLLERFNTARADYVSDMHSAASGAEKSWNYSAARPDINPSGLMNFELERNATRLFTTMVDDVWKQVDRPGYLARIARKIGHTYTKYNKSEKLAGVLGGVLEVGGIFLPMIKGSTILSEIGKTAVSTSTSVVSLGVQVAAVPQLTILGLPAFYSELVESTANKEAMEADIRGSGASIQALMPKVFTHFANALNVMKDIEANASEITTCQDAWVLAMKMGQMHHEMFKVGKYLIASIALIDLLASTTKTWAQDEKEIWQSMEQRGFHWVAGADHQACRDAGHYCYGPRTVTAGFFTRASSVGTNWQMAHKSL